ncbi:hypothetical protein DDB_G0288407 [Dictyostelium discoideum AX4]|uniref:Uncharacterized protein n=1 Tax=Dictyostelium discoideum TaxID=44689 RepID=Q54IZ6_DICDI|nr:hypothetical protein DDB_G0288407 [Dictyostelium discoideum AX4]EAL63229.1 hypothetical protein DDB_G0288407 [Dictyostelium discoideum AX4]|eukprot:XP_636734.1 hypothetical protein DDB_G0288407 [Dictyostelium discoideum AX4]
MYELNYSINTKIGDHGEAASNLNHSKALLIDANKKTVAYETDEGISTPNSIDHLYKGKSDNNYTHTDSIIQVEKLKHFTKKLSLEVYQNIIEKIGQEPEILLNGESRIKSVALYSGEKKLPFRMDINNQSGKISIDIQDNDKNHNSSNSSVISKVIIPPNITSVQENYQSNPIIFKNQSDLKSFRDLLPKSKLRHRGNLFDKEVEKDGKFEIDLGEFYGEIKKITLEK